MWIIGLTGAIGSGKSTLSQHFRSLGVPVHCADEVVHALLETDRKVRKDIKILWPEVFVKGKIDRLRLGDLVLSSPEQLRTLEEILYPKLSFLQKKFLKENQKTQTPAVVFDIPLLLEVGLDHYCHYVILADAPYLLRKKRVLKREGMTLKRFLSFESHQMTQKERRKYSDFIIRTGGSKMESFKKVQEILTNLLQRPSPKWDGKWPKTLKRERYSERNRSRHRNNGI